MRRCSDVPRCCRVADRQPPSGWQSGTVNLHTITLRDGRTLAWAEYGASDGVPVLLFHGTPGSRLDHDAFDPTDVETLDHQEHPGHGTDTGDGIAPFATRERLGTYGRHSNNEPNGSTSDRCRVRMPRLAILLNASANITVAQITMRR